MYVQTLRLKADIGVYRYLHGSHLGTPRWTPSYSPRKGLLSKLKAVVLNRCGKILVLLSGVFSYLFKLPD